jgi:hypothetical protein
VLPNGSSSPGRPQHASRRRRATLRLGLAAIVTLSLLAGRLIPAAAGSHTPVWPGGLVRIYDESGMDDTVKTAAERWSASGAKVYLEMVARPAQADVIVKVDDRRLLRLCGKDCLGYSTSIGRPSSGRTTILLRSSLGGPTRPLSVWVAAHELGHVIGLQHRKGSRCSVMSPHAFDTRCAPALTSGSPTAPELACVPAPIDVAAAASLYGGTVASRHPECK